MDPPLVSVIACRELFSVAIAEAQLPPPQENVTVGAEVYPLPAFVNIRPLTLRFIVAVAVAPEPPPPVRVTVGAEV